MCKGRCPHKGGYIYGGACPQRVVEIDENSFDSLIHVYGEHPWLRVVLCVLLADESNGLNQGLVTFYSQRVPQVGKGLDLNDEVETAFVSGTENVTNDIG